MSSPFDYFKDKSKTVKQNLRTAADSLLLKLAVVNNFAAKIMLAGVIKKEFQALGPRIKAGDLQLQAMGVTIVDVKIADLSKKLTSLTKPEIRDFIEEKLAVAADPAQARKKMQEASERTKDLSEEEYVFLAKLLVALMPPKIDKLHTEIALEGESPEKRARELYRKTIDQRTAQAIDLASRAPVAELTDAAYETLQKLTPQKLTEVLYDAWSRLNEKQAVEAVQNTFAFAGDFLGTVKKTNKVAVGKQQNLDNFVASMQVILTAAENSVIAAKILPADAKLDAMRDAFNKKAKPPANDNAPPAPSRKKGNGGIKPD